jgi:glycosyltransferase involved in cell wall biosynthesis
MAKRHGIESRVIFAGFVKKENVRDYFSAADIGVWPGNNSVSIMEAMACRLPIIMAGMQLSHLATYNNGLKFPAHDKEKLKIALDKVINDKKLRLRMADNSFSAIKKDYSYDAIAKQFLDLAKN